MVIHGAFFCIQFFAVLQCSIFGVIQDQVFDMQIFCQFTCIFYCGMMLLIWLIFVSLTIETECFVKEPFAVSGVSFFARVKWFVTAAGEFFFISQIHGKAELLCLGGLDIKKCHFMSENVLLFSVFYFNHMNLPADSGTVLFLKKQFCHGMQNMNHFLMSVDIQFSVQTLFCNILSKQTHDPDNSHDMIHMLVCNEDIGDLFPVNIRIFQLLHNRIATATVNKEIMTVIFNGKTGVVAFRDHGIAGT